MEDNKGYNGLEIAVIGMACRFPGASNIQEFWSNLKNSRESIPFFSEEELKEAGVDPGLIRNPDFVPTSGGVIPDLELFDAVFFGYTPIEVEVMSPQTRILHECCWEALEDAGYDPLEYAGAIGLYAGARNSFDWHAMAVFSGKSVQLGDVMASSFYDKDNMTFRVSYNMNLRGPCFSLNTACSTALVALHLACQGLLSGECHMALAGAVAVSGNKKEGYLFQEGDILSQDGHLRAFDAKARGLVYSDGAGMLLLKPLEEAIKEEDHIYAIIKGTAINNDGRNKVSYTAPAIKGQEAVIRAAMYMAEVEPESIGYIESHGTATPMGDPIEVQALKQAFSTEKRQYCVLGSVKTNLGHMTEAAGAGGFIKAVLALKNRLIPPTLHFEKPNPQIDFENSPFYVNTSLKTWERGEGPLRAGVSSFGRGGTNAHVILEEAPTHPPGTDPSNLGKGGPLCPPLKDDECHLILLSAKTPSALNKMTKNLANFLLKNKGINLENVSYTLQKGRHHFEHRHHWVCQDVEHGIELLGIEEGETPNIQGTREEPNLVFMYPGLGGQYINMGAGLYRQEKVFRETMNLCFDILDSKIDYRIRESIYPIVQGGKKKTNTSKSIDHIDVSQLLIFIFQYALTRLLNSWGIAPQTMIGYSFGEYTAAVISGVFTLEDALELILYRGKLIQEAPSGAMLSVPIPSEDLKPMLEEHVSIAIDNGDSCIVAGSSQVIQAFEKKMQQKRHICVPLPTTYAVHSTLMKPFLKDFEEKVATLHLGEPQIPFISNVTGTWITKDLALDPGYWARHLGETMRFSDGIKEMMKNDSLFVEIGPGRDLTVLLSRFRKEKPGALVVNLVRGPQQEVSDNYYLLDRIGDLWRAGVKPDWDKKYAAAGENRNRVSLPTYPFERQRFWIEKSTLNLDPATFMQLQSPGNIRDISSWFFYPTWKPLTMPLKKQAIKPGHDDFNWLLFLEDEGLGCHLFDFLEGKTSNRIIVQKGAAFQKKAENQYVINPSQKEHYKQLLREISNTGTKTWQILHLWGISERKTGMDPMEWMETCQELGFYSLLYLAQAIQEQEGSGEYDILVVTNSMVGIHGEKLAYPEKSTILSPVNIISLEYPNIQCRCLDVVIPGTETKQRQNLVEAIYKESISISLDKLVVFRANQRFVRTLEPLRENSKNPGGFFSELKQGGVYLITGGLGGLGQLFAEYLAEEKKARLVLTGRSEYPRAKMEKIRGQALYFQADVSNRQQMAEVVKKTREKFGPITGVIHAALQVDGAVIPRLTRDMVENVFKSKIRGTLVLDDVLREENLDFFVLFSSLGSINMEVGHAAYSAASSFLDAFAHHKYTTEGLPVMSINWDIWQKVGGVVQMAEQYDQKVGGNDFKTLLSHGILPEEGKEAFSRILGLAIPQILVSTGDLLKKKEINPGMESKTQSGKKINHRPKLMSPYIPPMDKLEEMLVEIFQGLFGIEKIGTEDDFFELGGDSLLGITLITRLKERLGEIVHITVIFNAPTIKKLKNYLKENYPGAVARVLGRKEEFNADINGEQFPGKSKITLELINQIRHTLKVGSGETTSDEIQRKNPSMIFILSPPRSGSTLLRVMLGGHPRLFAPPELELLNYTNLEQRRRSFPESLAFLLEGPIRTIMQIKKCSEKEARTLMQQLEEKKLTVREFYSMIQHRLEEQTLVDKTPGYSMYPEALERGEKYFDKAHYIHLTRHPYGMVRSYNEARLDLLMGDELMKEYSITRRDVAELIWIISHQNILKFLENIPRERQYTIKFEDLVITPQPKIEEMCLLLGLEFDPEMLQPYKEKNKRMTDGVRDGGMMLGDVKFHHHKKIVPGVAEAWKKERNQQPLCDMGLELAHQLGYLLVSERETPSPQDQGMIKKSSAKPAQKILENLEQYSDQEVERLLGNMLENQ